MEKYDQEYEISFENTNYSQEQKENEKMRKILDSVNLFFPLKVEKTTNPVAGDVYHDSYSLTTRYFDGKGWHVVFSDEEAMKGTVSPPLYSFENFMPIPIPDLSLFQKKLFELPRLPDWSVNPAHNNDGNFTITQDERELLDSTYEKVESQEDLDDAYERAMKVL